MTPCPHEWMNRGTDGDRWRECFLCGAQEDQPATFKSLLPHMV